MTLRQKVFLDRLMAKPLACLLNIVSSPFGRLISVDHDDSPEKVRAIAIAKFLGIGSILKSIPLAQALKQKYPSARYIFITAYKNKALVENISIFDDCLFINDASPIKLLSSFFMLLFRLWKQKIDLYFDLEVYSAFSTILALLSLARNRYGFYRESTRFRLGIHTHLAYFNDHQHITKIYLQFARACGIKNIDMDYPAEKLSVSDSDKESLKDWMESVGVLQGEPYVVINPNASDLSLERRWPMDYFSSLINALVIGWEKPIFLVGSPEEYGYNNKLYGRLARGARKRVFNSAGKISLMAAVALISKAKLIITNDSGFYHIAGIFSVPTISLWGPASPLHYSDMGRPKDFIFYSQDIYCSPCVHKTEYPPCGGDNICMKSISPKAVYNKACEILGIEPKADTSRMERLCRTENLRDFDIIIRCPRKKDG